MKHMISSEVEKARVAKWILNATSISKSPTWTEKRLAIEFGGHTYLVTNDQVFQCAHCGHYDPQWSAVGVLSFFEETFGIKPFEIEITCNIVLPKEN